jgi:hypothetical protein
MYTKFWLEDLEGRDHLDDLDQRYSTYGPVVACSTCSHGPCNVSVGNLQLRPFLEYGKLE